MKLSWLDDFVVLAATGNFSRAADERHMTQPAFSRRIRALEEWLGEDLLDRSSHPARLTETGEWFRRLAQYLLAQVARLPGEARAVAEGSSTTLRFAATHVLSFTFMPTWLRSMESRTDVGPIHLVSDVLQHCAALMLQSRVHFVLSHAHPKAEGELQAAGYPSVQIGKDVLIPVSAANESGRPRHPLLSGKSAVVPVLSYTLESGLGSILREVYGAALGRMPVQIAFTAHVASVLRIMALDGRGMAWLPETLIGDDMASGRLVDAASHDWRIDLEVRLYRDRTGMSRAAEAFWDAASLSS